MRNVNLLVSNVFGPVEGPLFPGMHKFVSANSEHPSELFVTRFVVGVVTLGENAMCAMISSSRRLCHEIARCNYLQCSKTLPLKSRCSFSTNPRWTTEPHQPWAPETQPTFASSSMNLYPPVSSTEVDSKTTMAYSQPSEQRLRLSEMVHHIPLAVKIRKQRDIPVGDAADPILRLLRYVV